MRHKSAGFTLVETIIALTVTSMLIFLVINFMTNSIVQYSIANARSNLLNEAQIALDIIGNDIRLSANADTNNRWPDPNAPDASNEFSWQSDNSTLILATAAEDANNNIIFADASLYISEKNNNIYFIENDTLYKRTLAAPVGANTALTTCPLPLASPSCPADKALINNVSEFTVTYINEQNAEVTPTEARSIEITLGLQATEYNQPVTASYTTRMVFRND